MSNQVATIDMSTFGPLAPSMAALAASLPAAQSEFSTGVTGGFGVVSIAGKVWRIKYHGNETVVMRTATEQALSIEVVLVKGSANISKIFYEGGFVKGDDSPPDCWSSNGITPAPEAAKRQATTCAACPKNAWGSAVTEAGKKAKACRDSRRLAIVPLGDIDNESFGGPMLLRVPPASLGELASFDAKMRAMGYPLFAIGVRISFDINSEYQKLIYSAIRPLTEDEAQKVLALRDSPLVARILDSDDASVPAAPEQVFEQPPAAPVTQAAAPAPAPAPAAPKPAPKPKATPPAPAPAPAATGFGGAPVAAAETQAAPAALTATGGFGGGFAAAPAPTPAPAAAKTPVVPATEDLDSLLDDLLPA
jgi:hypothetical protein